MAGEFGAAATARWLERVERGAWRRSDGKRGGGLRSGRGGGAAEEGRPAASGRSVATAASAVCEREDEWSVRIRKLGLGV